MLRERSKREAPARIGVPMRGTGAEQPVLVTKALQWSWSDGGWVVQLWPGVNRPARVRSLIGPRTGFGRNPVDRAKRFDIPKREVWEAYKRVRANKGTAGGERQTLSGLEADLFQQ